MSKGPTVLKRVIWLIIAVLFYGFFNYLSGKKYLPGCSFAELRPQICLPIFMGIYYGPFAGFVTGAAGDGLGYLFAGTNPLPLWYWAAANGLVGLISGTAGRLGIRRVETLKQMQLLYLLLLLATSVPFVFSCGMVWFEGMMPLREAFLLLFLPIAVTDALFAIILIPLCLLAARSIVITLPTATFLMTSYLTSLVVLVTFAASMIATWGRQALTSMAASNLYAVGVISLAVIVVGFALAAYFVRRITHPILALTEAADHIAREEYDRTEVLSGVKDRSDEFGKLAVAFDVMVKKVREREEKLKSEVRQLNIEINKTRQQQEVSRITGSDYFKNLKKKAADLRLKDG